MVTKGKKENKNRFSFVFRCFCIALFLVFIFAFLGQMIFNIEYIPSSDTFDSNNIDDVNNSNNIEDLISNSSFEDFSKNLFDWVQYINNGYYPISENSRNVRRSNNFSFDGNYSLELIGPDISVMLDNLKLIKVQSNTPYILSGYFYSVEGENGQASILWKELNNEKINLDKYHYSLYASSNAFSQNWNFVNHIAITSENTEYLQIILKTAMRSSGSTYFDKLSLSRPNIYLKVENYLSYTEDINNTNYIANIYLNDSKFDLKNLKVLFEVIDSENNIIFDLNIQPKENYLKQDISLTEKGKYNVKATLFLNDKNIDKYEQNVYVFDKPKGIDNELNVLVNNKPFFPIGIFVKYTLDEDKQELIKNQGFNTVIFGNKNIDLDLTGIVQAWNSPRNTSSYNKNAKLNDSNVFVIYGADQPDLGYTYWENLSERYANIRQVSNKPIYINLNNQNNFDEYQFAGDILSSDPYLRKSNNVYPSVSIVGDSITKLYQSSNYKKPVWAVIQSFWDLTSDRFKKINTKEINAMTYVAIANGAKGILYFTFGSAHPNTNNWYDWYLPNDAPELWDNFKNLNFELQTLSPVLLSKDSLLNVVVDSNVIDYIVKDYNNKNYLITVNASDSFQVVNFNLNKNKVINDVMFENRNIIIDNNSFADTFEPFERHVYVLN